MSVSSMHVVSFVSCTRQCSLYPNFRTVEPYRPQHGRPSACVSAQQYSSTIFSFRFQYPKEKFGVSLLFQIFYSFKMCKLKFVSGVGGGGWLIMGLWHLRSLRYGRRPVGDASGKSFNGGAVPCLDPSFRIFCASCSTISVWIN